MIQWDKIFIFDFVRFYLTRFSKTRKLSQEKIKLNMKKCKSNNCNRDGIAKGFCTAHYYYSLKHGETATIFHKLERPRNLIYTGCKYPDCKNIHYAKGYCNTHYTHLSKFPSKEYRPTDPSHLDGRSQHPLHGIWHGMIERCYNPKSSAYEYYGEREIKVCDSWKNDFWQFVKDMGKRPKNRSIDRIDTNGNYEPSNCRWATRKTQMNNKQRSRLLTASNLAKATGYSRERIRQLTGNSKSDGNVDILTPFVDNKKKIKKSYIYIYKPEAIEFLINHKKRIKKEGNYMRDLLFVPFNYEGFLTEAILTPLQLSNILGKSRGIILLHVNQQKIRKEDYQKLSKEYPFIENYLIKNKKAS